MPKEISEMFLQFLSYIMFGWFSLFGSTIWREAKFLSFSVESPWILKILRGVRVLFDIVTIKLFWTWIFEFNNLYLCITKIYLFFSFTNKKKGIPHLLLSFAKISLSHPSIQLISTQKSKTGASAKESLLISWRKIN